MTAPNRNAAALAAVKADQSEPEEYATTATIAEVMDSVNGYDELGIEQHLGRSLEALSDDDSPRANNILLTRACVAVHRQHAEGDSPAAAWKFAMTLGLKDLMAYFSPKSADEDMGLEDTSESGKDAPRRAAARTAKPGSA